MADLEVIVTANITKLKEGLSDARKEIANTATSVNKLDSSLKTNIADTQKAGTALIGLGNASQKAQTGLKGMVGSVVASTGGLQNLAGSLIGSAGVGLALTAVAAIITVVKSKFGGFTKGLFESDDALEDNKKSIELSISTYDRFKEKLEEVTKTMATEASKVSLLFNALSDSNAGLTDRKEIISELIKISPAYFDGLDAEKSSYQQIAQAVNDYNDGLAKTSQIKALLPQFEGMIQKVIQLKVELNELNQFQGGAFGLPDEEFKAQSKVITDQIRGITNEIQVAKKALSKIAGGSLQLQEILFGKADKKGGEKTVKDIQTIDDVLLKLEHDLISIQKFGEIKGINIAKEQISTLDAALKTLLSNFNLGIGDERILKIQARVDEIELKENLLKTVANIENAPNTPAINIPLTVSPPQPVEIKKAFVPMSAELLARIKDLNQQITDALNNAITSGIAGIGEAIGNTIAKGGNLGEALFGDLFKVIAEGLTQLGKAMIALGTAKIALEKFEFAPGIGTVLAGIAAVALGAILRNAVPQFAEGGFVSGPGGPRSDSIPARLSNGEYVMSASTVSRFGKSFFDMINSGGRPRNGGFADGGPVGNIGGFTQTIIPDVVVRGSDLLLVFDRATAKRRRNG